MNIPDKDLRIIEEVASFVVFHSNVSGYPDEDLRQDMTIHGLQSYQRWDDEKHRQKGKAKRDNNLRIFLKTYMTQRLNNVYKANKTLKRAANFNVTSLNPGDPAYEVLTSQTESSELTESDFYGLDLSDDQISVLMYIGGNGLEDINEYLDMEPNRIESTINSLSKDEDLRSLLKERLQSF